MTMICDELQPSLPLYQAGALDPVARGGVDAHLLDCRPCLRCYLEIKNASEDAPLGEELPSAAMRTRLRDDVRRLAPAGVAWSRRPRRTWMMGAAVAALALLAFAFARRTPAPSAPAPLIDSDQAETSLTVL